MKKFLPYILILAVVAVGALGPLGTHKSEAVLPVVWLSIAGSLALWAALFPSDAAHVVGSAIGGKIMDATVGRLFAWIMELFFNIVNTFLLMAGYVLDYAITKSLDGSFTNGLSSINKGWAVCRDVANLFFIFILLYIAIATILQLSGYGMKELLVKVIIVALLVNFSLVITRFIIDGSNILALEFYSKIKVETVIPQGGQYTSIDPNTGAESTVQLSAGDKVMVSSPSLLFMKAIRAQTIFSPEAMAKSGFGEFKAGMVYLGGTAVILIVTFVFFTMAIFFIIRSVVLVLLMIFSPLAFLAMAVPAFKSYANKWWQLLFNQAFFAPIFIFFIYLSAQILADPKFSKITSSNLNSATFSAAMTGDPSAFAIIFNFLIIIILLFAALMFSTSMAKAGSGGIYNLGEKARNWTQAKAGKISRRGAGKMAEGMLNEESWINKKTGGWAGRIAGAPIIGKGFSYVSNLEEKEKKKKEKEWEKQYGSYSEAGLNAMMKSPMFDAKRKVIQKMVEKKEELSKQNQWYKDNKDKNFDAEIVNHIDKLAELNVQIPATLDYEEKKSLEREKIVRTQQLKEAEKDKEKRDKIKNQKLGIETSVEERMKKLEEKESGGAAKPAPASDKTT